MAEDPWNSFKSLDEYRGWVEADAHRERFTFRVGVFDKNRFYFDQHGHFFQSFIPEPPADKKAEPKFSILGIHTHVGVNLSAEYLFEAPKDFVRQGDVIEDDAGFPALTTIKPSHWVVLSQTCTVENDTFVAAIPAYTEERVLELLGQLGVKPPNPPDAIRNNRKPRLLALPPNEYLKPESALVLDLGQIHTVPSEHLKKLRPVVSLTLPGNAYLSCRAAMFLFRDVKGWDDQRALR